MLETIKSSTEISRIFSTGKRYTASSLTILVQKRDDQHDQTGRAAFIAGKKLGNAVWRNQAKRRLRALCRDLGGPWESYDVVFIAKSSIIKQTYSTVCRQCLELIERASIMSGR